MEAQPPQPCGRGGPCCFSTLSSRAASCMKSEPARPRLPGSAALHARTGLATKHAQSSRSSWEAASKSHSGGQAATQPESMCPSGHCLSAKAYEPVIPFWQQDALELERSTDCASWAACGTNGKQFPWNPWTLFGSNLERKARDPASCGAIDYNITPRSLLLTFLGHWLMFLSICLFISLFHHQLETQGLNCSKRGSPAHSDDDGSFARLWVETLVTSGATFMLAQGLYGYALDALTMVTHVVALLMAETSFRAARERMERVRQMATTLAYSFLKTTAADPQIGLGKNEMQLLIYECLALLTAYPVALLQQIRGNTCEPAITKYCQEVARTLKQLRGGRHGDAAFGPSESEGPAPCSCRARHCFATVEYFFEIFSIRLQLEYDRQPRRTKAPSMTTQHIIFNLRNHFENLVDLKNVDDRRTPIIRENVDLLSLAGRECAVYAQTDVIPSVFLRSVSVAAWLVALYSPFQRCDWFVDWTPSPSKTMRFPSLQVLASMGILSMMSAMLTTTVAEMWKMWDPFGRGINPYGWTLGIAKEIDNVLNDFFEHEPDALLREHIYMNPVLRQDEMASSGGESSEKEAHTV